MADGIQPKGIEACSGKLILEISVDAERSKTVEQPWGDTEYVTDITISREFLEALLTLFPDD